MKHVHLLVDNSAYVTLAAATLLVTAYAASRASPTPASPQVVGFYRLEAGDPRLIYHRRKDF